jgi:hypothetical protein
MYLERVNQIITMQSHKTFNIDEARALLPRLRELLEAANADLLTQLELVRVANQKYEQSEQQLADHDVSERLEELRNVRANFQSSIEELSNAQSTYLSRLNYWVDEITATGVILRDLREGLLDFPAEHDGLQYLLCWRMDELDISTWHMENDGFQGRKPLAALAEYF